MNTKQFPQGSNPDHLIQKRVHQPWGSPVPELSFLPAPHKGLTRAGEKRVQDNLHTHAQNEPIKNYWAVVDKSPYHAAHVIVSRNTFFQVVLWKKNSLNGVNIVVKNKLKCGLSLSVLLSTTSTRHYSFPKHFFALFLHVERVCKSFWKKSLTRTSSSFA